ncbi:MAG TPA: LuxR C-terminal-related transcriptional regulator [Actinomycetota bacterium]|nr:LuxR C-terminal-related transcriptional regulator [Actinomycetota bacterium]
MSAPILIFLHGPMAGKRIPIDRDELTIGRSDTNDVVLDDKLVSRLHAIVMRRGDVVLVEDLGSNNGTYVQDERLHAIRQLHDGQTITIGTSRVMFEDASASGEETTQIAAGGGMAAPATFTQRQMQVLRLLARGLSNKQIGERLFVSERTVKAYLSSIFDKLEVGNRSAAITAALRLGLIDIPGDADASAE